MKKFLTYTAASFLMTGTLAAQQIDINAMPKAGPTPTINIKQPKTFNLKNGLTVMVVEDHKLPRVNVMLMMDNPPFYEGDIAGVTNIMGEQLDKGTQHISKDDFSEKVDFMGASINFSSQGAYANTLSKYFTDVLGLMADAIVYPKFKSEEVETSKDREIENLKSMEKSASAIASRVNNALIYGKNTARGEFETKETVANITLKDVQQAYQKYYIPNNAYLVIVGDVEYGKVKSLVKKLFKNWKKADTQFEKVTPAQNVATTEIDVVNVPNAVQSVINIGNVTTLKMNNPQYFAAKMGNYILGGGGNSRLFMNLREEHGYTYGAYSNLGTSKYAPRFSAGASVRNDVTAEAVTEFMKELKGIDKIKPEELEVAKAKLKGSFIMSLEEPSTIANFAVNKAVQNLPDDFYKNYLKSIDKVTAAQVASVAQEFIKPQQSRIFIAGKATEIAAPLEKLGYPINYYDKLANKTEKPEVKKVAPGVSLATIGEKYIQAIGGKAAVEKINSITTTATATIQGMKMQMVNIQTKDGKLKQEVKMMGKTMNKTVFDGKGGYMVLRGQKTPLNDKQLKKFAAEDLFPELAYGKSDTFKLKGIEPFNGTDAYVVEHGDKKSYYSVATGLKIGEAQTVMGKVVPTTFSDYREVSGIKMPYKISQKMGPMDITFEVQSYEMNAAKASDFK